jgi:hypothetical protein
MSTWRIEAEDGEEVEEVEEEAAAEVRSRLARNATNFGMAAGASIHPGEYEAKKKRGAFFRTLRANSELQGLTASRFEAFSCPT